MKAIFIKYGTSKQIYDLHRHESGAVAPCATQHPSGDLHGLEANSKLLFEQ